MSSDRRFGPEQTECRLACCDTCIRAGEYLCQEWLAASSVRYSSANVWSFAEYAPDCFALLNERRHIVLLTNSWEDLLYAYRNRPEYVAPVRKIAEPKFDLSKLEIKL